MYIPYIAVGEEEYLIFIRLRYLGVLEHKQFWSLHVYCIPVTGNPSIVSFIDGHPSIYVFKQVL